MEKLRLYLYVVRVTMPRRKRDFAGEERALQVLLRNVRDLSKEIDFNIEGTSAAFASFYQYVNEDLVNTHPPQQYKYDSGKMNSYDDLPMSPDMHIRGYFEIDTYTTVQRTHHNRIMEGREVHLNTFHSAPIDNPDSDIPTNADIYAFIKYGHRKHVVVGPRYISILSKTYAVLDKSRELWKWELDNPNAFTRIEKRVKKTRPGVSGNLHESRERFAKSALRGIELRWPSKKYQKRNKWPTLLTKVLGVHVERIDKGRVPRIKSPPFKTKSDAVLAVLSNQMSPCEAARKYRSAQNGRSDQNRRVSASDVRDWIASYKKAGTACLESVSGWSQSAEER